MQIEIMNGETIKVDGVTYAKATAKPGNRAVVVCDRGWIFAGDVEDKDGRIRITRAIHVFRWESMGFSAMVAQGKGPKVDLRPCADVDMPSDSELFRIPVGDSWGL